MTGLLIVCGLIAVGAFFLFRASGSSNAAKGISDADALLLRDTVQRQLQERLPGWTVEPGPSGPFELIALEAATERRIVLHLEQLAGVWLPLHVSGANEEADGVIEDFVDGVTGQRDAGEETTDTKWIHAALALQLLKPDQAPKSALTRPAGPLVAALVMRSVNGPEAVTGAELESWGLSEAEAFRQAYENLSGEVEDAVLLERVGDEDEPAAFAIAPGDPLASSYALIPGLRAQVLKRFDGVEPRLFVGERQLIAATEEAAAEEAGPLLIEGAQPLDAVMWKEAPAA